MYVVPSLVSQKGNNFGTSSRYLQYISKDTDGLVFNNMGENVKIDVAILNIDINSRGGIRKNEARWYSPVYSFSEDEALCVAASILQFGTIESRHIVSFDDLTSDEKRLYNSKITQIALKFQDAMAKNFDKQNLGINGKDDVLWYGSVENKRKYTGWDNDVKKGTAKQGQEKIGFNTHIHICQSRKALNEKKSLISPMANARTKTHQGAGFNRNIFYNIIEQVFDQETKFKRKKTFEQYKAETKTVPYWQARGKFQYTTSTSDNRKPNYSRTTANPIDKVTITNEKCVDYFFQLEKRGLLQFDKQIENQYYFKRKGQRTGSITVSEKGWFDFSDESRGGILKAIQMYDKFDWNQSIALIKSLNNDYTTVKLNEYERKVELVKEINKSNLLKYIDKRGINVELAVKYLQEVYYKTNDKTNYSIGFKNNSGGFTLRSDNFKSNIGPADITAINSKGNCKNVLVFEGFFNYLSYLQLYRKTNERAIIMNSSGNYKKMTKYINENDLNDCNFLYYGDNDRAGNTVLDKLNRDNLKVDDKRYLYTNNNDLNSYIIEKYVQKVSNIKKVDSEQIDEIIKKRKFK